jgi:hypothetical protein
MEKLPPGLRADACASAYLGAIVDSALNGDAREEARHATSETQGIGSEPVEYEVFNSFEEVKFKAQEILCRLCHNMVSLSTDGSIEAPDCSVSGSCEYSWARLYPGAYLDDDGEPVAQKLPCSGDICGALLGLTKGDDGGLAASIIVGSCPIDVKGSRQAMEEGLQILANTRPTKWKKNEIEPYDGI